MLENILNYCEKNKKKVVVYLHKIILLISILIFLVNYNTNISRAYFAILLLFLANIIYCLQDFNKRIILLLFHFAFFAFLLGRTTVNLIQYGQLDFPFNDSIIYHILLCLYISLFSLYLGNFLFTYIGNRYFQNKTRKKDGIFEKHLEVIRKWSKVVFIIGFVINLFFIAEKGLYILQNSYILYARDFNSSLPSLLRVAGNLRTMAFFIFLATFPSKKESRWYLFLYLIEGILSLTYGDRGNFVMNIFFLGFYFVFRQGRETDDEIWIKKKHVVIVIILMPILIAFLSFFVYIREGFSEGQTSLIEQFVRFFKSIGGSVNVIGYGKYFENQIPANTIFSFGDITQYIFHNPISNFIFNNQDLQYYTKEYALQGTSFMHTISYLIDPKAYLGGHGYGSCYIAEFYNDFGYTGVIFINIFIGSCIAMFNKISKRNIIFTACCLLAIHTLFYIPRGPADYLITYPLNITSILSISIIMLFSKYNNKINHLVFLLTRRNSKGG